VSGCNESAGSVFSRNLSWSKSISFPRDWLISVARGLDTTGSIFGEWSWQIVVETGEEVRDLGKWPLPSLGNCSFICSHVFRAFKSSHVWGPESGLSLNWLMHADHVEVVSEAGTAHFEGVSFYESLPENWEKPTGNVGRNRTELGTCFFLARLNSNWGKVL